MMIKALLVDDEPSALNSLHGLLNRHCPNLEVVDQCNDIEHALSAIQTTQPDLLFLDVEMPPHTGFELLQQLPNFDFEVIFTTAYQKYALDAIKFSALDYLLKPINSDDLIAAVSKIQHREQGHRIELGIQNLLSNLQGKDLRLAIPDLKGVSYVKVKEVIWMEADRNYTTLYLTKGRKLVSTRSLRDYESLLRDSGFFRVHHSTMVNLEHVVRYDREAGGFLTLSTDQQVEVSRRKKKDLLDELDSFSH